MGCKHETSWWTLGQTKSTAVEPDMMGEEFHVLIRCENGDSVEYPLHE